MPFRRHFLYLGPDSAPLYPISKLAVRISEDLKTQEQTIKFSLATIYESLTPKGDVREPKAKLDKLLAEQDKIVRQHEVTIQELNKFQSLVSHMVSMETSIQQKTSSPSIEMDKLKAGLDTVFKTAIDPLRSEIIEVEEKVHLNESIAGLFTAFTALTDKLGLTPKAQRQTPVFNINAPVWSPKPSPPINSHTQSPPPLNTPPSASRKSLPRSTSSVLVNKERNRVPNKDEVEHISRLLEPIQSLYDELSMWYADLEHLFSRLAKTISVIQDNIDKGGILNRVILSSDEAQRSFAKHNPWDDLLMLDTLNELFFHHAEELGKCLEVRLDQLRLEKECALSLFQHKDAVLVVEREQTRALMEGVAGLLESVRYGILHPIRRLPQELLEKVFTAFMETEVMEWRERMFASDSRQESVPGIQNTGRIPSPALSLSHVSRRWRTIAISRSSLWTSIPAIFKARFAAVTREDKRRSRQVLRLYLDRCKVQPIDLINPWMYGDEDQFPPVRRLSVIHNFSWLAEEPVIFPQELFVGLTGTTNNLLPIAIHTDLLQNTEKLTLERVSVTTASLPSCGLRALHVTIQLPSTFPELLRCVLENLLVLQELVVKRPTHLIEIHNPIVHPIEPHPSLAMLAISIYDAIALNLFSGDTVLFPSLGEVRFQSIPRQIGPLYHQSFGQRFNAPKVTLLDAEASSSPEQLARLLGTFPCLVTVQAHGSAVPALSQALSVEEEPLSNIKRVEFTQPKSSLEVVMSEADFLSMIKKDFQKEGAGVHHRFELRLVDCVNLRPWAGEAAEMWIREQVEPFQALIRQYGYECGADGLIAKGTIV